MSFKDYVEAGWALCEFAPGTKGPEGPGAKGWNERQRAIVDPQRVNGMLQGGLLHAYSGTCSIDVDSVADARPFLAEHGVDLDALIAAPDAVQIVSGRPNRAKLIYRLPAPMPSKKLCRYESLVDGKKYHAIEFRCAARQKPGEKDLRSVQDVLPPSVHPDTGRPYQWRGDWRHLPLIPEPLLALWLEGRQAPADDLVGTPPPSEEAQDASLDELRGYLEYHTDYDTYDTWVNVGMALHKATGGDPAGLALWDEWSRRSTKYGEAKGGLPPQFPADKWPSFHADADGPGLDYLKAPAPPPLSAFPVVVEEFPQPGTKASDIGVDTRPGTLIRNILSGLTFISSQGLYYDEKRGALLNMQSIEHLYTPMMPVVHSTSESGAVRSKKPNPVHVLREAFWKEEAYGLGMHPAQGKFFTERGRRYLNTYENPNTQPVKPTKREMEAFEFLWSRPDEEVFRDWLRQFYAYAVQKPGEKITSAPLLVGYATGSGKNTLMKIIPQLLFSPQYVTVMTNQILQDKFSDQLANAWWVYFEELHSGSFKGDRIGVANRVKSWITDDTVTIRPMFGKAYDAPNRIQITASSNYEDDAIFVDKSDRRWIIGHIEKGMTPEEGQFVYDFLNSERAPGVLHHIFRNISVTGFNPKARAPDTAAKKVMVSVNYGIWESKILEMMEAGTPPFDKDLFQINDLMLYMSAGMTSNRLGRILQREPLNAVQFGAAYAKRLYAWRNQELWAQMGPKTRDDYYRNGVYPEGHPWASGLPASIAEACGIAPAAPCDLI